MSAQTNIMPLLGAVVLLAVSGYYGFYATDALGLENRTGTAVVTGKEHRPAGTTYRTEVIAGNTRAIPQSNPEMYLVTIRVGEKDAEYPVARELYEGLSNGDQVSINYRQRRLTGAVQVLGISRK